MKCKSVLSHNIFIFIDPVKVIKTSYTQMVYTPYPWKPDLSKLLFASLLETYHTEKLKDTYVSVSTQTNHIHKILERYTWKIAELCNNINFIMHLWPAFCLLTNSAIRITSNFPTPKVTLNCSHLVLTSDSEMILQSPLTFGVSIRIAPVYDPGRKSCPSQNLFLVKVVMFYGSLLLVWLPS